MIMIRKLIRIVAGSQSRRQGPEAVRGRLKLRPRIMELEGRALLSTFMGNTTVHHGDLETLRPAAGTPALDHVVLRGNSARVDGGLPNDGLTNHRDVAIRNNTGHLGSGLSGARDVTNARRVHPRRGATGLILSDNFNGTGGVPKNWMQFGSGVVKETAGNVTLTDISGQSVGILSSAVFSPQAVNTTIQAQIKSVSKNPVGNAIVGILGAPNSNGPTGELAAGIDANGDVFVVVQQQTPAVDQTIMLVGTVKGYKGGPISLTLTIKSAGVTVSAGSFNSPVISFSNWKNFSLIDAFGNDAIPALVGASQQNQKGGSASFSSIKVSTAAPKRR
jgi:hypothetical protein